MRIKQRMEERRKNCVINNNTGLANDNENKTPQRLQKLRN